MSLIQVVAILLVIGVSLWGINSIEQIDVKIKRVINILVMVVVVIWLLSLFFPGIHDIRVGK